MVSLITKIASDKLQNLRRLKCDLWKFVL